MPVSSTLPAESAPRGAGFQTCRAADFQIGESWNFLSAAALEARDTADWEVRATTQALRVQKPKCSGVAGQPHGKFMG
jgi:hypothetical protein